MTAQANPYVKVYYSIVDDPKFADVYDDNDALATWLRLLLVADGTFPAPAPIPDGTKRRALDVLVRARLIEIVTGRRYRLVGLPAERDKRSEQGRAGGLASARSRQRPLNERSDDNERRLNTERTSPLRSAPLISAPLPTSLNDEEQREQLDKLANALGVNGILPPKKANGEQRPYPAQTDTEVIERMRSVLADESAPQWKRDAARAQLEAMRVQP